MNSHWLPETGHSEKMYTMEIGYSMKQGFIFPLYLSAHNRAPSFYFGFRGRYGIKKFQSRTDGQDHPNKLEYGIELILCGYSC